MRVESVPPHVGKREHISKNSDVSTTPALSDDAVYFDPEENRKKREQQERDSSPQREQSQHSQSRQELPLVEKIEVLVDGKATELLPAPSEGKTEKPRSLDVLA